MPATAAAKMTPRMIKPFVVRSFGGGSGPYTTLFSLLNLDLLKLMFSNPSRYFFVSRYNADSLSPGPIGLNRFGRHLPCDQGICK